MGKLKPLLLAKTALGGGGGGALKLGVLRGDAELIQRWTYDKRIVRDEGKTIPSYSTSATAFISSANLDKYTCPEADRDLYDYYVVQRGLVTPVYNAETKVSGRCEYVIVDSCYDLTVFANPDTGCARVGCSTISYNFAEKVYRSGAYMMYVTSSSSFPIVSFSSPTFSVSASAVEITPKSPALQIKGSANYFTSDAWAMLTDIRYQYIIELYKIKKKGGIDGGASASIFHSAINDINNNNGTLR